MMFVSLYTSRVILQNLGVNDYGIYGAVGGIVGFMGFLNGALATSSSRFLTYALGEGDIEKSTNTFKTTLTIHVFLGLFILLIGEAIGPWMIETKMLIPTERIVAAHWAFQLSLLTTAIGVSQVPYSATIVAHEKMSIYAYMAIFDVIIRFAIATSLFYWGGDKLVYFSVLLFIQSMCTMFFYRFYCGFKFKEAVFKFGIDKTIFRHISTFSGWSLTYNLVYALNAQGTTVLMGMFFNPVVIAAKSISVSVNQMTTQFIGNFRQAMNPQIVKLYAAKEHDEFKKLTLRSGLYSFFIMWVMTLPICLLASQLLSYWLGNSPNQADYFCQLIMIDSLFWLFDCSFNEGLIATGDIKANTIYTCIFNFLRFPILYVVYRLNGDAVWAFYISIVFGAIIGCVVKPWLLVRQCRFKWIDFIKIYGICINVVVISSILPFVINFLMPEPTVLRFLVVGTVSVLSTCTTIYYCGIEKHFRKKLIKIILKKLNIKYVEPNQ